MAENKTNENKTNTGGQTYTNSGFNPMAANGFQAINDLSKLALAGSQSHAVLHAGMVSVAAKLAANMNAFGFSGIYATSPVNPLTGESLAGSGGSPNAAFPWMSGAPIVLSKHLSDALADTLKVVAQASETFNKAYSSTGSESAEKK